MDALRLQARRLRNAPTDVERHLWYHLRRRELAGHRFRRQVPVGGYVVDFACPAARLVLELDGGQHLQQRDDDMQRTRRLQALGWRVLRYWNDDVLLRTDAVLEDVLRALGES